MLVDSRGFVLALPLPSPHVVTGEDGLTRLDAALASLAEFLACMRQAEAASRLPDGPQPSQAAASPSPSSQVSEALARGSSRGTATEPTVPPTTLARSTPDRTFRSLSALRAHWTGFGVRRITSRSRTSAGVPINEPLQV